MHFAEPTGTLIVRQRVLVATDRLLAHLHDLDRFIRECESDTRWLASVAGEVSHSVVQQQITRCHHKSVQLVAELYVLRAGIISAEAGYTAAERAVRGIQDLLVSWVSGFVGRFALPFLPFAVGGAWVSWKLLPGSETQKTEALQRFMLTHPEIITNPDFVRFVGLLATNADDLVLGAAGAPPWLAPMLGEQGLGLLGVGTSAGALVELSRLSGIKLFTETPVRIEKLGQKNITAPPLGASERLARIPTHEHVRIERYSAPGAPDRYIVYIAPTKSLSPLPGQEVWDMTSNITAMAGQASGSLQATEMAMSDAGITANSEVMLVGYSQGGLIGDVIAGSGKWNVVALESYGAPGSGVELPEGVRALSVRHSDDFVTATGFAQQANDRTIVERRVYPEGAAIPNDLPVPAHQKRAYVETAKLLDAAESPQLRGELFALDRFTGDYLRQEGAGVTEFSYRAERAVPAETPALVKRRG